jgi:hypothetical protein
LAAPRLGRPAVPKVFAPKIDQIVFGAAWSRWCMALLFTLLWPISIVLFFRQPIVCRTPGRTKYAFAKSVKDIPVGPVRPHFRKEFDLRLEFAKQCIWLVGLIAVIVVGNVAASALLACIRIKKGSSSAIRFTDALDVCRDCSGPNSANPVKSASDRFRIIRGRWPP